MTIIIVLNFLITLAIVAVIYYIGKKLILAAPKISAETKDITLWIWMAAVGIFVIMLFLGLIGVGVGVAPLHLIGR